MIREFIHDLGGPKSTAEYLRERTGRPITDKAVSAWGIRKTVPWKWREPVALLAMEKDIAASKAPEDVRRFMREPLPAGAGE